MRAHVVDIGPNAIRRLCCGVGTVADSEMERIAFENIDDPVALVDLHPVSVESLWRSVLESMNCGGEESIIVIYPSWWSPSRVGMVGNVATVLGGKVVMKPRSWLLRRAGRQQALVIEIADGFVVVTGDAVVAESRRREQRDVVEAVVGCVLSMASGIADAVVIDAPRTVPGAGHLSALIAKELQDAAGVAVMEVGDIELRKLAGGLNSGQGQDLRVGLPRAGRHRRKLVAVASAVCAILGVGALIHNPTQPVRDAMSTTYLVEGHVALEVPAGWNVRRVVAGPGSARLLISSPSDPEMALHVTQSRVALESLDATAEFLRGAIDAAPTGVFVDFNPAGRSVGRAVVTYREIRPSHDVRWTVWVDKAVRISIGCQSRHGNDEAVRQECDLAVRSARALM